MQYDVDSTRAEAHGPEPIPISFWVKLEHGRQRQSAKKNHAEPEKRLRRLLFRVRLSARTAFARSNRQDNRARAKQIERGAFYFKLESGRSPFIPTSKIFASGNREDNRATAKKSATPYILNRRSSPAAISKRIGLREAIDSGNRSRPFVLMRNMREVVVC